MVNNKSISSPAAEPSDKDTDNNSWIENKEQLIHLLAANLLNVTLVSSKKKSSAGSDLVAHALLLKDLGDIQYWIEEAYHYFNKATLAEVGLSIASEWILDNFYVIRQSIRQIKEDLSGGFYYDLPKANSGIYRGLPRIYGIAKNVLAYQNLLIDSVAIEQVMIGLQKEMPLTMAEIWALPIFLRYCLLEYLAEALLLIIEPTTSPLLPKVHPILTKIKHPLKASPQNTEEINISNRIANIILSLRAISEINWNDFFESVSLVDSLLRKDPAAVYTAMDFKTRDLYRAKLEELARGSGYTEIDLAYFLLKTAADPLYANQPPLQTSDLSKESSQKNSDSIREKEIINFPEEYPHPGKGIHIGEFLIGKYQHLFAENIGYRPPTRIAFLNWIKKHASAVYLTSVLFLTILLLVFLALLADPLNLLHGNFAQHANNGWELVNKIGGTPFLWIAAILVGLAMTIPALTIATSFVNWIITLIIPPSILPKMEFKRKLPVQNSTMVVIPGMISSYRDINSLVNQIEMHYLRNPEQGFQFAILTDFGDADQETRPEDENLIIYGNKMIEDLNQKYAHLPVMVSTNQNDNPVTKVQNQTQSFRRFFFFHRKRLWNPSEGKWMGWERKRGKIHELNGLLRGSSDHTFISLRDDLKINNGLLDHIQYVITLDSDTILPIGAGKRLVGTMAHPLNQPVFSEKNGRVISGYTILQPRMEIHPKSANQSWFTRIFAGDAGLDLYTLAVSDAYQDLFGEGIYVGKGIYDVDAFEQSIGTKIPENSILSHDLLEGNMGRAGLVTDITMVEDYPPNYIAMILRQRRWIRGDWQLLPWLFKPNQKTMGFNIIDRWKIFDNLRRSLLAPALLFIFSFGLLFFPGLTFLWASTLALALAIPLLTGITHSALQIIGGEHFNLALQPLGRTFLRWLLAITFIVYESYISIDAILTTLYRLFFSHKRLLQWTTAAQTAHIFRIQNRKNIGWQKMLISVLHAIILAVTLTILTIMASSGEPLSLMLAGVVLLLWLLSPIIVYWLNRPIDIQVAPLKIDEISLLRQVARRTWSFFERFVGPEDHWLPPDHYQETPGAIVAHRTSPTNIGLLLTSTLAAYDLGYLNHFGLVARLEMSMESLSQLERYRGHFLNWYNTLSLEPLNPRYVSTVDSGNLASCFIITDQACKKMPSEYVIRWELWQGYLDSLTNLSNILLTIRGVEFRKQIRALTQAISDLQIEIRAIQSKPDQWFPLFLYVIEDFWPKLSNQLLDLITTSKIAFDHGNLMELKTITTHIGQHQQAVQRNIADLLPWVPFLLHIPPELKEPDNVAILSQLTEILPGNLKLNEIKVKTSQATPLINALLMNVRSQANPTLKNLSAPNPVFGTVPPDAKNWLIALKAQLQLAGQNAEKIITQYKRISQSANKFVEEMDFRFLYSPHRRVFHIGFNLDAGILDSNYYDLLASEARIASLIAIAKRDVPQSHWVYLSRPVTRVENINTLLSWSGTMFEYLMPPLFLRSYSRTLLADSVLGAVKHQIAYAKSKGVPWGISESGFYRFDSGQSYQYRAFGVPGLGFKRGLDEDLVIAPYASIMAIAIDPKAVIKNLNDLIDHKMFGLYGFYEALDFTESRLLVNEDAAIVGEYMAHHQGMLIMALDNYLHGDIMVTRMHADTRIQSVELLLQEQVPPVTVIQGTGTEDVQSISRFEKVITSIPPWKVPVNTAIPQMHILSNGNFEVLISNMGSGYLKWRETDLTRWQPDPVLDPWGTWIYIQDQTESYKDSGKIWSAAYQPLPGEAENMQVSFHAHMVVFRRVVNQLVSAMEVAVSPDDPVEIRKISIQNNSNQIRNLRITSYGEVILAPQATDAQHPAFNKLFIESEYVESQGLQIFSRRPRSKTEAPLLMGHMLISKNNDLKVRHESNRNLLIGRGHDMRDPRALLSPDYLSGSTGATLDPVFALGAEVTLNAHENLQIAFLTFAGESREDLIYLADQYKTWSLIERSFHQADINSQSELNKVGLGKTKLEDILKTLSALLFSYKEVRAPAEILAANRLGQSALWRFGISGDLPILLVTLKDNTHLDILREALLIFKYLRSRNFKIDLVILNQQFTNYGAELNGLISRLIHRTNSDNFLNLSGGIYTLYYDHMKSEEITLLQSTAGVILRGENGPLAKQIPDYSVPVHHLPQFSPSLQAPADLSLASHDPGNLQFFNGYGGFSKDGKEYHILFEPGKETPAPWVNVIGYQHFGFMVSESGSQTTWAINSGENRLTPWFNDPVCDPTGEALYLRDEETGQYWSPTPSPAGPDEPFLIRHGAGYTVFEHQSHRLIHKLTVYASPSDPVKIIRLQLSNLADHTRRITATQYIEWVLGTTRARNCAFIIPEYDFETESLLARNPYNSEFDPRTAFLSASKSIHGMTADRTEFLGRAGTMKAPKALERLGLERRITTGEDPCAVLQVHVDLEVNASQEIYFILGQADNRKQAIELINKYHKFDAVEQALTETIDFWDQMLESIQVQTPDDAMNLLLNRWSLYQVLSCRIWGRTAFYQSSGAYGFRDQLQDVLALLPIKPEITRNQILRAAAHQFEEGDVLHWWHPPTGRGVRTRISDDLLWLPYVTAHYITVSGDYSILDEEISYIHGAILAEGEGDRYGYYETTQHAFSLYDHCLRAIEKGCTKGIHNLPLIGSGDWNDGLNRVGEEGRGESTWLAWFLVDVLNRFAVIVEKHGDQTKADELRQKANLYAQAVEENGWDGDWYLRGYYDSGKPLGSHANLEGQIDSIAQSWAVISAGGEPQHSRTAMNSVFERLVRPEDRLILLFTPPFDETPQDPGYIKGYLPGIRENGGQYTHAAVWTAWAFCNLEDGNSANQLFEILNPILQADDKEKIEVYRVEPYVVCADIYSVEPYVRRGGWTWYTGSAAWLYRLGVEGLLGFQKEGETLRFAPVIPESWDSYKVIYHYGKSTYHITVENPQHGQTGVAKVVMDGKPLPAKEIILKKSGGDHTVTITIGQKEGS